MIGQKIKVDDNYDDRGLLMAINQIPFEAKRLFFITNVPEGAERGNHYSKTSSFLYIVIKGACIVDLDDGYRVESYYLTEGNGLLFNKNIWMKIYGFQRDTILCVIADKEYRVLDYVSDYEEFKKSVRK